MRSVALLVATGLALIASLSPNLAAASGWQDPPAPIAEILDRPGNPSVYLTPDRRYMLALRQPGLPPIADMAEPVLRLAGLRINPVTRTPARATVWSDLAIQPLEQGRRGLRAPRTPGFDSIALPEGRRIRGLAFSPDSRRAALQLLTAEGLELWLLDIETRSLEQLTGPELNATNGRPCAWLDDENLLCKVDPGDRPAPPERSPVPPGPVVEENRGRRAPARTYADLLSDEIDEALFSYHLSSALDRIHIDGSRQRLVDTSLLSSFSASPDARFILLRQLHPPFSYHVPHSRFPQRISVIDRDGGEAFEVDDLALADDVPITFGSVRRGRRTVSWRADHDATLYWVEALDDGDAGAEAEHRDALFQLPAPFDGEPAELWRSTLRYGGVDWGNARTALVYEWWYDNRLTRSWVLNPEDGSTRLLVERNYQDQYADPGDALTRRREGTAWSVLDLGPDGDALYLEGRGPSDEGVFPFLDRWPLATLEPQRVWRSGERYFDRVVDYLPESEQLILYRQAQDTPPHHVLSGLRGRARRLTDWPDPVPELDGLGKRIMRYTRADGVELSATLYTPAGYDAERDGPLPTLLWAYPREHKSRDTAGQVTTAENTFSRPSRASVLFLLTQGYAVMAGPTMPILGEGEEEPNDRYVEQLVSSAEAAVEALVATGVGDRDRLAIGGHSYGAFTTANLLAHTDLFRAGIARSGAYNRTLTPFGFQGEQRSFWDARPVYMEMSPFTQAARINQPILLIHGAEDRNSGTWPMQSERFYEALKGLGAHARYVVLPLEDHGYRSREAVGHTLWEMVRWLDEHVKNAGDGASEENASEEGASEESAHQDAAR